MTAMIMVMVMMVMVAGAGGGRCSQICPHQGKRYFVSFVFSHHHHHHSHHHHPQLVIRGSVILNLFLLLYLSLYAGWTTSFASNTEKPFNREILNSYFEVNYCLCFETLTPVLQCYAHIVLQWHSLCRPPQHRDPQRQKRRWFFKNIILAIIVMIIKTLHCNDCKITIINIVTIISDNYDDDQDEGKSGGPLSISPNTFCYNSNQQFR